MAPPQIPPAPPYLIKNERSLMTRGNHGTLVDNDSFQLALSPCNLSSRQVFAHHFEILLFECKMMEVLGMLGAFSMHWYFWSN